MHSKQKTFSAAALDALMIELDTLPTETRVQERLQAAAALIERAAYDLARDTEDSPVVNLLLLASQLETIQKLLHDNNAQGESSTP